MFTLETFTSILAFLSFSVQAFPLSQRDVIAPPITQPNASSVWPVGSIQVVTWDTSNIPPASEITNPTAQIILGFVEGGSLNLDFNNPLAQNFPITAGSVQVTVPNVPPRDIYVVVLFGDSGDASPAFAITQITSPDSDTSSSSALSSSTLLSSTLLSSTLSSSASSDSITEATLPTTSPSIPSSVTTPTWTTTTTVSAITAVPPTGTTTTGSTSSSSNSNSVSSNTGTALAASSTSAGWSLHRGSSLWNSAAPFLMSVAPFVMVFIV